MKKILLALMLMLPMGMMAQNAKFGHFNRTEIIPLMPEYITGMQEMETLQKQMEEDMKRMYEEYQENAKKYEAQRPTLPENIRTRRDNELVQQQERIQQAYQDNMQVLQKKETELLQSVTLKLTTAVKKIGDAGNYVYIMDSSGAIPYINDAISTDITPELKKELGL